MIAISGSVGGGKKAAVSEDLQTATFHIAPDGCNKPRRRFISYMRLSVTEHMVLGRHTLRFRVQDNPKP